MNKKEIIKTLKNTKQSVIKSNCQYIEKKANEREFQVFLPNRFKLFSFLIKGIRKIFIKEIAHALELELNKQREINLRLVKEIELLQIEIKNLKSR